ncbi:heavy metal translocating P-type ATPase metal-binding domain-containing protein [Rhabdobacter roseus]|uniref:Cu+-exporting ATPase n=1 Tax=Rhabdobacter roseus TaxID=1655419 RepID=A0A840TF64_9BACT|nr:heavy metal translocating P-type ATPase metal-binding domain-containing protein [Rhabdobacter roseus]MBB5282756.1 Cu+-exporting ATPase [Rhabdobacter roseus]
MKKDEITLEPAVTETCYHCGDECRDEPIHHDDHSFCCEGCKLVYDVLKENDLCQYYRFEDSKGISPGADLYEGKFDYLDLPDVQPKLLEFTDGRQARVNWLVPKMHCSSCIWLLEQLHRLHPGVVGSVVNFPEKKVRISYDPTQIKLSELAELIARLGYEPYISLKDVEGKVLQKWNRTRLFKIGLAGFAFGNIMMLSLPEYFDLGQSSEDQNLRLMFTGLNVLLSIPVFFYSASDFFVSAWKALRGRYLNIDAPIALALLGVFLVSLYQVGTQTGPGYFDSLAGAVFFMLVGRYFQDKTYASISFDRDYKSYFPVAVAMLKEDEETRLPITDLRPGDHILIRNRELVPADAVLASPRAMIDYSFVSGEAELVERRQGDTIYAGGRQVGPAVEMEVLRRVSQSYLTQLWNNDTFTKEKEDQHQTLAARINRYFSVIVMALAAVTFVFWISRGQAEIAFNAFTTVLLVACPCALLLSSTFTNGNLLSLFGKYRFYLKNSHAIERLSEITSVVFDKTGTMTLANEAEVHFVGEVLADEEKAMVKALAAQSSHPLSRLVTQSLAEVPLSKKALLDFCEVEGAGTSATWGKHEVRLGSARWVGKGEEEVLADTRNPRVYVALNGQVRGYFNIKSKYRPELAEAVTNLRQEGYELYLLSGDKPTDRDLLSPLFGGTSRLHFQQKPEDKLRFVAQLQQVHNQKVLMVGDGLNDAGALQQSDVGLAVSNDINNFSPACDALVEGDRLALLPRYIRLAQAGQRIVKTSFGISLIYNAVGVSFAVAGQLTPVVAAILMPISSITIVLFTTAATNLAAHRWMNVK